MSFWHIEMEQIFSYTCYQSFKLCFQKAKWHPALHTVFSEGLAMHGKSVMVKKKKKNHDNSIK